MEESFRVTIEVIPWLTDCFDHRGRGRLRIEENVGPGTTILELLQLLGQRYPRFGQAAFRGEELGGHISVLLNGRWLQPSYNLEHELGSNDRVTLLPAFTGGSTEVSW